MHASHRGFTVAEVLVAVVVLAVGLLALAGSWAQAARMIGHGRHATVTAAAAMSRVGWLHRIAAGSVPRCSGPEWVSGSSAAHALIEEWNIRAGVGPARRADVVLRTRAAAGWSDDTVVTAVLCGAP